jgi:hypothetical protein
MPRALHSLLRFQTRPSTTDPEDQKIKLWGDIDSLRKTQAHDFNLVRNPQKKKKKNQWLH